MRNNICARKKIELALKEDKITSNDGLTRLIRSEIVSCLSDYLEIDAFNTHINIEADYNGVTVNCKIRAFNVKRFGLNS